MQRTEVDLFTLVCRVVLGNIFLLQLHRHLATVALESNGEEVLPWVTSVIQVDDCRMHSPTTVGLRRGNCPCMENKDCLILGMLSSVLCKFYITLKYILEKARELDHRKNKRSSKKLDSSRKISTSALLTMPKPLTVWITTNCGKFLKRWEYQTTLPAPWEICMQVKKQQLELDMEQQTGSKLRKEYVKAVYCHPDYLTYMQSTSWETLGWKKH